METQWYVRTAKRDRGPYTSEKLRRLATEGKIKPETLISRDEKATWFVASQITELEFDSQKSDAAVEKSSTHIPWYEGQSSSANNKVRMDLNSGPDAVSGGGLTHAEVMFARWRYSGIIAAIAGWTTYALVRLLQFFGLFRLTTVAASLTVRIGIPTAVLISTFAFVLWKTRHLRGGPAQITPDMTDEEIANEIKGR